MKNIILITLFFSNAYAQGIECDNNFSDCGTPEQSGGGGGGKGSVLIANTDLGDSYQHADDYDDDGIEDPSDNCMRDYNPQQLDSDGDSIGDMCDNCISIWNESQENADGDMSGDFCDDDIDGDNILNSADECPYQWGNSFCFEEIKQNHSVVSRGQEYEYQYEKRRRQDLILKTSRQGCAASVQKQISDSLLLIGIAFLFVHLFNRKKQ